MSQKLPLPCGRQALVDAEDVAELSKFHWAVSSQGYAVRGSPSFALMHRVILGAKRGQRVDHINDNKLDNRHCNLRFVTAGQNLQRSRIRKDSSSGYRGVKKTPQGRWQARITHNGQEIFLGNFREKIDAARTYDREAIARFGEHAYLNFPKEGV